MSSPMMNRMLGFGPDAWAGAVCAGDGAGLVFSITPELPKPPPACACAVGASCGSTNSDRPTASVPQACDNLKLAVILALHCLTVLGTTSSVPPHRCGRALLW